MIAMNEVFIKPEVVQFRYLVMSEGETLVSQILMPCELAIEGIEKAARFLDEARKLPEGKATTLSVKGHEAALWRGDVDECILVGNTREALVSIGEFFGVSFLVAACLQKEVFDYRDVIDPNDKVNTYGMGIEGHSLVRAASHQFDPHKTEVPQEEWGDDWEQWGDRTPLMDKACELAEELFRKRPLFFVSLYPKMAPGHPEKVQAVLDFMPYIAAAMMQETRTVKKAPPKFKANVPQSAVRLRPDYD
jgi:hypothetical protein